VLELSASESSVIESWYVLCLSSASRSLFLVSIISPYWFLPIVCSTVEVHCDVAEDRAAILGRDFGR